MRARAGDINIDAQLDETIDIVMDGWCPSPQQSHAGGRDGKQGPPTPVGVRLIKFFHDEEEQRRAAIPIMRRPSRQRSRRDVNDSKGIPDESTLRSNQHHQCPNDIDDRPPNDDQRDLGEGHLHGGQRDLSTDDRLAHDDPCCESQRVRVLLHCQTSASQWLDLWRGRHCASISPTDQLWDDLSGCGGTITTGTQSAQPRLGPYVKTSAVQWLDIWTSREGGENSTLSSRGGPAHQSWDSVGTLPNRASPSSSSLLLLSDHKATTQDGAMKLCATTEAAISGQRLSPWPWQHRGKGVGVSVGVGANGVGAEGVDDRPSVHIPASIDSPGVTSLVDDKGSMTCELNSTTDNIESGTTIGSHKGKHTAALEDRRKRAEERQLSVITSSQSTGETQKIPEGRGQELDPSSPLFSTFGPIAVGPAQQSRTDAGPPYSLSLSLSSSPSLSFLQSGHKADKWDDEKQEKETQSCDDTLIQHISLLAPHSTTAAATLSPGESPWLSSPRTNISIDEIDGRTACIQQDVEQPDNERRNAKGQHVLERLWDSVEDYSNFSVAPEDEDFEGENPLQTEQELSGAWEEDSEALVLSQLSQNADHSNLDHDSAGGNWNHKDDCAGDVDSFLNDLSFSTSFIAPNESAGEVEGGESHSDRDSLHLLPIPAHVSDNVAAGMSHPLVPATPAEVRKEDICTTSRRFTTPLFPISTFCDWSLRN